MCRRGACTAEEVEREDGHTIGPYEIECMRVREAVPRGTNVRCGAELRMKLLTVVGARPQFIKAGALTRALAEVPGCREVMVHTGQHFDVDMSQVFFDELDIPPPGYNLDIHGGGHGEMTGRMLMALEPVMMAEKPDAVVVYGDTNSTAAAALCAAKLAFPVVHVEAGLRSFNRRMPEELNRVVADHLSDMLLAPTRTAIENLEREGITRRVHHIGDVMYDVTLHTRKLAAEHSSILQRLRLDDKSYALATMHRAENTDDPKTLGTMLDYLRAQAETMPLVFPLHPRTRAAAKSAGVSLESLLVIPPVGYLDMQRLLTGATQVFTDSGGLQKEAYFHRVPCVTMRSETEWVETVEAGWNRLWQGPDYQPRRDIGDYGEGEAAQKIVELLQRRYGNS